MKWKQMLWVLGLMLLVFFTPADSSEWVARPVPGGVSIGNMDRNDAEGFCGEGTLGCMLRTSTGGSYGLSNRHVVDPGEGTARYLDNIVQPGKAKPDCTAIPANRVGFLNYLVPIKTGTKANNKVDAARFSTTTAYLREDGLIRDMGPILSMPVEVYKYMTVFKSGMTTE